MNRLICVLAALVALAGVAVAQNADSTDVEKSLGELGQKQDNAAVFQFPRSDLRVTVDGFPIPTELGLTSWAAFKNMGSQTMMASDLVLLADEVAPVLAELQAQGFGVSAVHDHFIGEQPRLAFVHVMKLGDAKQMGQGIRAVLAKTATPKAGAKPAPTAAVNLDTARLGQILGTKGKVTGSVYKVTVGRAGVKAMGFEVSPSLGMNSWAGFTGSDADARATGDLAMTAGEVGGALKALLAGGFKVAALHNHMLDDNPRIFFVHFWGKGPADQLAQTVRNSFFQVRGPVQ